MYYYLYMDYMLNKRILYKISRYQDLMLKIVTTDWLGHLRLLHDNHLMRNGRPVF